MATRSVLGHSFDPEGLVIDPNTDEFIVADEYGPSVYVFDRKGRLVQVFDVPGNLVPKVNGVADYVAIRDDRRSTPADRTTAVTRAWPSRRTARRCMPSCRIRSINEPRHGNNGRNGRNVRIVVYDNDHASPSYGTSIKQLVYQLELQADVAARINAQIAPECERPRTLVRAAISASRQSSPSTTPNSWCSNVITGASA